jgi:hypothetical protein
MGRKLFTTLLQAIEDKAVKDPYSDCWNWRGATQSGGNANVPVLNWRGRVNSVRRLIVMERYAGEAANLLQGRKRVATYSCGNPACVNPEHTILSSRKAVQNRTAEQTSQLESSMRGRKTAAFARKTYAVLDAHKAEEIRLDDRPQKRIAADYGVSQATVSSIKRGKTWKTYDNPFLGLMR